MRHLFIVILLTLLVSIAMASVKKVKIHGKIQGLGNNEVVLLNSDYTEIARVQGVNDRFEMTADIETDDARYYNLYVPAIGPLSPSMSVPTFFFFIDSPDIRIKARIEEKIAQGEKYKILCQQKITGSGGLKEYQEIFAQLPVKKELEKAGELYNKAFEAYNYTSQTDENYKILRRESNRFDSLQNVEAQQLLSLIPTQNKSKILAGIIYNYFNYKPTDELEKIYSEFNADIRDCYGLKKIKEKLDLVKSCEIGQPSPDFELKDLDGKLIKLSSLRGKYTLIDFWASWCGPCRKEIPNLKKVYADYKDRSLQLIGISLDESDQNWKKAVEEEQLDYLQLNDPKNITSQLYNFSGIPFIILISPEGIILEKNLRGSEIREKVAQYIP